MLLVYILQLASTNRLRYKRPSGVYAVRSGTVYQESFKRPVREKYNIRTPNSIGHQVFFFTSHEEEEEEDERTKKSGLGKKNPEKKANGRTTIG